MTCPKCDTAGCEMCDGRGEIYCARCLPDEFRPEPCSDCLDELNERLKQHEAKP